ncbi:MAG: hypothetical protein IT373_05005 [Polyangiaceae bacterium]|nr:hypothetical protein [Polyangiaceae bacterium]
MPPRPERAWSARHAAPIQGALHFVVDATSVGTTMAAIGLHGLTLEEGYGLVLAYDLLAFAPQFAIGLVTDRLRAPRPVLQAGLVLIALGAGLLPFGPVLAMVLVGLGNALFHVGASVFALSVAPQRAAPAGVFVAPGALGLGLGMWLGNRGAFEPWPFIAALGVCLGVASVVQSPELPYPAAGTGTASRTASDAAPAPRVRPTEPALGAAWLVVSLLCLSIAVRAFVGMGGSYACPKGSLVALGLPLAAFGGKALGGWLADRLGWVETGVGALVVSAPLIAFGGAHTEVVLAGLFFFQMTMPVTLAAAVRVTPARPGFAFGLTCLALVSGSLPSFLDGTRTLYGPPLFLGLVLASAAALYAALRLLGARVPERKGARATRASVAQSA